MCGFNCNKTVKLAHSPHITVDCEVLMKNEGASLVVTDSALLPAPVSCGIFRFHTVNLPSDEAFTQAPSFIHT